jgi:hypothetical protein
VTSRKVRQEQYHGEQAYCNDTTYAFCFSAVCVSLAWLSPVYVEVCWYHREWDIAVLLPYGGYSVTKIKMCVCDVYDLSYGTDHIASNGRIIGE